jgi:hypothetical protein
MSDDRPPESTRWVGGLNSWDAMRIAAETIRQFGARPTMMTLTHMPDAAIKTMLRARSSTKPIGSTIVAKIMWDGINGESEPVRLSHRVQRRIRHFERHRHLCRQFFPKRARY